MQKERIGDLIRFYQILGRLAEKLDGARSLRECSGKIAWPRRGVYFFMESGEQRSESGVGPRIVRVGTHALSVRSRTTLWNRLSQHKGTTASGGGNHRGSIFRLLVGTSLIERGAIGPTWGRGSSAPREVRAAEIDLEREVSKVIGAMAFLWLAIDDEPGAESLRGDIERNSIALLSNFQKPPLDKPSVGWLGHSCDRPRVRQSGLWNSNHVDETYDPEFLTRMERLVTDMERSA
jgi:hypothetical protein